MPRFLTAPDIHLKDLAIGYPGKRIMGDINATLPGGKISVILGGSGCGKSTLLRHILGLSTPQEGAITIGDIDIFKTPKDDIRSLRQSMGVLFQDGALLGSLTIGENVALPMQEHTDLDDEIIEQVVQMKLDLVGLGHTMHYYPSELSGGMRKRAGLARAMVMDPAILLCDEPSAGLDPITAADLDKLILALKETFRVSIVVVTHDLDSLFTIADYVLVLGEGKLLYRGDLEGLRASDDTYIRKFLVREGRKRDNCGSADE